MLRFFALLLLLSSLLMEKNAPDGWVLVAKGKENSTTNKPELLPVDSMPLLEKRPAEAINCALLTTRFHSLEELKKVVHIEYFTQLSGSDPKDKKYQVRITHRSNGRKVTAMLQSGISEHDFREARDGDFWDRLSFGFKTPYSAINRNNLLRVNTLAKRNYVVFGEGDVAFFDFAETMFCNISGADIASKPIDDLTEKGYINTFNHINGQALVTTLFSEKLADLIADAHELFYLPALITGNFTEEELNDVEDGPIDNYVDLVNNEWGQELGKELKEKYNISRETHWTPELLTHYMNDMLAYYSWALQIGFRPYSAEDDLIIRFSDKINRIMDNVSGL